MAKALETDLSEAVEEENGNPLKAPGFHVTQGKTYCGTFESREDAELYIEGHLTPQKLEGKVTEVAVE